MANHGKVAMATGLNIGTLRLLPKFCLGFGKTSIKAEGGKANYFLDVIFFLFLPNLDSAGTIRKYAMCI